MIVCRIRIQESVDFRVHVYFQAIIHCSQNLVNFLPLSMPFGAFSAKRHGTRNNYDIWLTDYADLLSLQVLIGRSGKTFLPRVDQG